jgi:hypothetical protein
MVEISSGDISEMVFKRVIQKDSGSISLDGDMLNVLVELNGKVSAGDVARKIGMSGETMWKVFTRLLNLGLIESVQGAVPLLSSDFFHYLHAELSMAVGPLAEILVEDAVEDMGMTPGAFPRHRAAELVDALARQIPREEKRIVFQHAMLKRIREGRL